jgi:hypothetical protein
MGSDDPLALGLSGGPIPGRNMVVNLRVNGGAEADDAPVVEIPVDDRDGWIGAERGQATLGLSGNERLMGRAGPGDLRGAGQREARPGSASFRASARGTVRPGSARTGESRKAANETWGPVISYMTGPHTYVHHDCAQSSGNPT